MELDDNVLNKGMLEGDEGNDGNDDDTDDLEGATKDGENSRNEKRLGNSRYPRFPQSQLFGANAPRGPVHSGGGDGGRERDQRLRGNEGLHGAGSTARDGHGDSGVRGGVLDARAPPLAVGNVQLLQRELTVSKRERDVLMREKALLQREVERLRNENRHRERDVNRTLNATNVNEDLNATVFEKRIKLTFEMIANMVNVFNGDSDFGEVWLKRFEFVRQAHNLDDETSRSLFYKKMVDKALAWLDTKPEYCMASMDVVLSGFKNMYVRPRNRVETRERFQKRKWSADESFREYVHDKTVLGNLVPVTKTELLDYIVEGIPDQWLRDNARIKCFDSVDSLIKAYDQVSLKNRRGLSEVSFLKTNQNTFEKVNVNTGKNNFNLVKKTNDTNTTIQNLSRENKTPFRKKCPICNDFNHSAFNCPSKNQNRKCFICNQVGHIAYKCPKKDDVVKNVSALVEYREARYLKDVLVNGVEMTAHVDTGSDLSLMRKTQHVVIGEPKFIFGRSFFKGVGSDFIQPFGKIRCELEVDGLTFSVEFNVVDDKLIREDVLLGVNFLKTVDLRANGPMITITELKDEIIPEVCSIQVEELIEEPEYKMGPDVPNDVKFRVKELIDSYVASDHYDVGIEMTIILKDDKPIYQPARRLSVFEREIVDAQVDEWLEKGIIRPSSSEYASPVVLVQKRDNSYKLCVDYRRINKVICRDRFPMPRIDDVLDALQGAKIFTTLDLENGFFHVPVEEKSRKYTSFVVPGGQYEFLYVPFGLSILPAVFLKFVSFIFRDLIRQKIVIVYMDDFIIPAVTYEEGMKKLQQVLEVAGKAGLKFKWRKCEFFGTRVEYLGNVIENNCVRPSERKIKALVNFPELKDVRGVQAFLRLSGYFRRFVKDYATIARPLTDLLRSENEFVFGGEQRQAFETLKQKLTTNPVLRLFNPEAETEVHTDASKIGIGAILMQRDRDDGKMHPVIYYSKKNSREEERYSSYELEVLAAVKAIKKFKVYLMGRHFTIVTDCKAFEQTMQKEELCDRIHRWAMWLNAFPHATEHRPGKNMPHADALSRYPVEECYLIEEDNEGMLARVRKAQQDDREVQKLMAECKVRGNSGFLLQRGLLYKEEGGDVKLVVPKVLQRQIVRRVHDHGHFSAPKTEAMLKRDFWMPGTKSLAENVVKNCILCILAERKSGKQEGWLRPLDKGSVPLETLHIDHAGPMTKTKKQYRHLLVVVDAFSKFVWLYPVRSTGTAEVLDRLRKQAAIFGNPRQITSDRGTAFTSNDFTEYCRGEGITHHLTTTGIPRANGQVERVNRTVIPLLAKLAAPKPENWFKHVEHAQLCLNSVLHRSLKETPFKVMFGVNPRVGTVSQMVENMQLEILKEFEAERDEVRAAAARQIAKIQEENKKQYNKKRKEATRYQKGDLVAIRRTQQGPGLKLRFKFLGPYEIVKVSGKDRYEVMRVGEGEGPLETRTAADSMKPWFHEEDSEDEDEDWQDKDKGEEGKRKENEEVER